MKRTSSVSLRERPSARINIIQNVKDEGISYCQYQYSTFSDGGGRGLCVDRFTEYVEPHFIARRTTERSEPTPGGFCWYYYDTEFSCDLSKWTKDELALAYFKTAVKSSVMEESRDCYKSICGYHEKEIDALKKKVEALNTELKNSQIKQFIEKKKKGFWG
jgi:hypothetical protein